MTTPGAHTDQISSRAVSIFRESRPRLLLLARLEGDVVDLLGRDDGVEPGVKQLAVLRGLDLRLDRWGEALEFQLQLPQQRLALLGEGSLGFTLFHERFGDGLAHSLHLRLFS